MMLVLSEAMICSHHTLASQILTICLQSSIYERMTHWLIHVFYQLMVKEERERDSAIMASNPISYQQGFIVSIVCPHYEKAFRQPRHGGKGTLQNYSENGYYSVLQILKL
jgi:hypothetical protein